MTSGDLDWPSEGFCTLGGFSIGPWWLFLRDTLLDYAKLAQNGHTFGSETLFFRPLNSLFFTLFNHFSLLLCDQLFFFYSKVGFGGHFFSFIPFASLSFDGYLAPELWQFVCSPPSLFPSLFSPLPAKVIIGMWVWRSQLIDNNVVLPDKRPYSEYRWDFGEWLECFLSSQSCFILKTWFFHWFVDGDFSFSCLSQFNLRCFVFIVIVTGKAVQMSSLLANSVVVVTRGLEFLRMDGFCVGWGFFSKGLSCLCSWIVIIKDLYVFVFIMKKKSKQKLRLILSEGEKNPPIAQL